MIFTLGYEFPTITMPFHFMSDERFHNCNTCTVTANAIPSISNQVLTGSQLGGQFYYKIPFYTLFYLDHTYTNHYRYGFLTKQTLWQKFAFWTFFLNEHSANPHMEESEKTGLHKNMNHMYLIYSIGLIV
jgi:hypothetical protein